MGKGLTFENYLELEKILRVRLKMSLDIEIETESDYYASIAVIPEQGREMEAEVLEALLNTNREELIKLVTWHHWFQVIEDDPQEKAEALQKIREQETEERE